LDSKAKIKITILNWEKHQRVMRANRKQRDWVAVSTRLVHDPDFFNLTIEQRYLWMMLICHAGAVGPVFELSPHDARVLFKLRKNPDFAILKEKGFVALGDQPEPVVEPEVEPEPVIAPEPVAPRKASKKPAADECLRFDEFWSVYPIKRNKSGARKAWKSKKLDARCDELMADVSNRMEKDRQWLEGYIPHAQTYINGERWEDEVESKAPQPAKKPKIPTDDASLLALCAELKIYTTGKTTYQLRSECAEKMAGGEV